MALAHLELTGPRLLGNLGICGEQCDVPVGIPCVQGPAIARVQLVDFGAILRARPLHDEAPDGYGFVQRKLAAASMLP